MLSKAHHGFAGLSAAYQVLARLTSLYQGLAGHCRAHPSPKLFGRNLRENFPRGERKRDEMKALAEAAARARQQAEEAEAEAKALAEAAELDAKAKEEADAKGGGICGRANAN